MITIIAKLLFSSYQDKEKVLNLMRIWPSAMRCAYGRYSLSELMGNPIWAQVPVVGNWGGSLCEGTGYF